VICPGRDASRENGILRSLIVMVLVTKIEKIRGDYAFGIDHIHQNSTQFTN